MRGGERGRGEEKERMNEGWKEKERRGEWDKTANRELQRSGMKRLRHLTFMSTEWMPHRLLLSLLNVVDCFN